MTDLPVIDEQTFVQLRNVGDTTYRQQYAGRWYEITPGSKAMVPYYAMCLWLGNPKAQDVGTRDSEKHRTNEVRRLSTWYGVYADPWYAPAERTEYTTNDPENRLPYVFAPAPDDEPGRRLRHPQLPLVEVYTFDTEERIYTVIDDPEGNRQSPATTSRAEQRDLEKIIRDMAAKQDAMMAELRNLNPAAAERIANTGNAPTSPMMPDPNQELADGDGPTEEGFDEKEVVEEAAQEDLPPSRRPTRAKSDA